MSKNNKAPQPSRKAKAVFRRDSFDSKEDYDKWCRDWDKDEDRHGIRR